MIPDDVARLHAQGLHLFPLGPDKKPLGRWRRGSVDYVWNQPSEAQIAAWAQKEPFGWALLAGGPRSLVCVDIEADGMSNDFIAGALEGFPLSCRRPSPSGGEHAWIAITDGMAPGNEKLAVDANGVLLAETRGEGGYAAILGAGRGPLPEGWAPWPMTMASFQVLLQPIVAADERAPEPPPRMKRGTQHLPWPGRPNGTTSDVLFNMVRDTPELILECLDEGWDIVGYTTGGRLNLIRPDYNHPTDSEVSANVLDGILVVWSTSVPWNNRRAGSGWTPAQALAASRFGGDFRAAMQSIEQEAGAPYGTV